jgi:hypothetical protein
MAIPAHHLNTVKIKNCDIREFLEDIKRMKIRHRPFRKIDTGYEVDIYSTTKATFLMLKYS